MYKQLEIQIRFLRQRRGNLRDSFSVAAEHEQMRREFWIKGDEMRIPAWYIIYFLVMMVVLNTLCPTPQARFERYFGVAVEGPEATAVLRSHVDGVLQEKYDDYRTAQLKVWDAERTWYAATGDVYNGEWSFFRVRDEIEKLESTTRHERARLVGEVYKNLNKAMDDSLERYHDYRNGAEIAQKLGFRIPPESTIGFRI